MVKSPFLYPIFQHRRCQIALLISILLIVITACSTQSTKTATSQPTPEMIATAYASYMIGELINNEGCIQVRNQNTLVAYTLVWPPDVSGTIEDGQVKVVMGIVRKKVSEIVLDFGDVVFVGGGESAFPDEKLLQQLPSSCQPPYWIVGFEVKKYQPTSTP